LLVIVFTYGSIQSVAKAKSNTGNVKRSVLLSPSPTPIPDNRIKTLQSFFNRYSSPLSSNAIDFIEASDLYDIDYRLLPAIAGVESTFGKFTPSCAFYNSFGWSSPNSSCNFYPFQSYKESIYTVARGISRDRAYIKWQTSKEISLLAKVYCPVSTDKWVSDVIYFMDKIK
jgi:hypothetical protein